MLLPVRLVPLVRVVVPSRRRQARSTSVVPARKGNARSSGFTVNVKSPSVSSITCGQTKPTAIVQPQRLQVAFLPSLVRLVEVGVPQEMVRLVAAAVVRRRGARKALVVRDKGRVVPKGRAVLKALGAPVVRPVPVRRMARGSSGRGRVPALLVARVNLVLRVKPHLVILRVGNPNLSLPVRVGR